MTTDCYAMVRGSALRVTGLDKRGAVPETIRSAASKSVTKVTLSEVTNAGTSELIRSDRDDPRLNFRSSDKVIRFTADIDFLRVDPELFNLISGVPIVHNAAGDVVGFDAATRLPATSFALEVWSQLSRTLHYVPPVGGGFGLIPFDSLPFSGGDAQGSAYGVCGPSTGMGEGGMGEGEFGGYGSSVDGRLYGYTLFPFLKGGVLSGFSFSNGAVSFSLRGAQTRRTGRWGVGPHDLEGPFYRLSTPVSGNLAWRTFVTPAAPPAEVDGVIESTDVLDNGTAPDPGTSTIYGGRADSTSPNIIDGGRAA